MATPTRYKAWLFYFSDKGLGALYVFIKLSSAKLLKRFQLHVIFRDYTQVSWTGFILVLVNLTCE
jgi:hypothetical protein